jgi:hypothetical protein
MRLVALLKLAGAKSTLEQLMALVQALEESDGGYTPLLKKGQKEGIRPSEASRFFGHEIVNLLQRYCDDTFDYWARCKRAAILGDWISGTPVTDIETNYTATPYQGRIGYGDIRKFADNTRFHLRSAYQIAAVLFPDYGAHGEAADILIKRLEQGLPADALPLLELPLLMERGDYLSLFNNDAKTPSEVWRLSDIKLAELLGQGKAKRLKEKKT